MVSAIDIPKRNKFTKAVNNALYERMLPNDLKISYKEDNMSENHIEIASSAPAPVVLSDIADRMATAMKHGGEDLATPALMNADGILSESLAASRETYKEALANLDKEIARLERDRRGVRRAYNAITAAINELSTDDDADVGSDGVKTPFRPRPKTDGRKRIDPDHSEAPADYEGV